MFRSLVICMLTLSTPLFAQKNSIKLLGDFEEGWQKNWIERDFGGPTTLFEIEEEDTNKVLMAKSKIAASGLWRPVDVIPGRSANLTWRWKVKSALSGDNDERDKRGDDYAARVFVVFEPHMVNWKTRAICYVWAAKEPVESIYRNPYSSSVGMVVLQSGNDNRKDWMQESRDLVADYQQIFNEKPEFISGVAIMVDTDNTNQEALAWFDDIILEKGEHRPLEKERSRARFEY